MTPLDPPSSLAIKALAGALPTTDKSSVPIKWIVTCLLAILDDTADGEPENEKLRIVLAKLLEPSAKFKVPTLMAGDLKTAEVCRIFQLKYDWAKVHEDPWTLNCELHTPPKSLIARLQDFRNARYDPNCEATSRIAADLVIIACSLKLQQMHTAHYAQTSVDHGAAHGLLTVYPELILSTVVSEPTKHTPLRISGRADWGFGYSARTVDGGKGSYVIAVEAKSPSELASAESQLLAYLGMMRAERIAAAKKNPVVQGFVTDGREYQFICVSNDGTVRMSERLRIMHEANRKTIYNWIVTMMDTAIRGTPSASPTKHAAIREQEINEFENTVWRRSYNALVQSVEIREFDEDTMDLADVFTVGR